MTKLVFLCVKANNNHGLGTHQNRRRLKTVLGVAAAGSSSSLRLISAFLAFLLALYTSSERSVS